MSIKVAIKFTRNQLEYLNYLVDDDIDRKGADVVSAGAAKKITEALEKTDAIVDSRIVGESA